VIEFKLGNMTFHYTLSENEKVLMEITDETTIDLNEYEIFSSMLNEWVLKAIPEERTPPTLNEIETVEIMAKDLNLVLPENYQKSTVVCRQFIHKYRDKHNKLMAVFNNIKGQLLK
jgi:hypothetical protein